MKTPAGKQCRYYYEDFNRGRSLQECRAARQPEAGQSLPWQPKDCSQCPVPDILNANASADLSIEVVIRPRLLGLGRGLMVNAWCTKHDVAISDPFVGCERCNQERPGLDQFLKALEE
jgi:hypothetical protein